MPVAPALPAGYGASATMWARSVPIAGERMSTTSPGLRKRSGPGLPSASVGEEFFQVLVRHLVRATGADYAFIGELTGPHSGRVRTIAVCQGERPMENFEFLLAGTPCEEVVEKGLCSFSSGVRDRFPLDHLAAQMGVESYIGIPLVDSAGVTLGPMVLLGRRPIDHPELAERLLRIFAVRAAAELERRSSERTQREQLHFMQTLPTKSSLPASKPAPLPASQA